VSMLHQVVRGVQWCSTQQYPNTEPPASQQADAAMGACTCKAGSRQVLYRSSNRFDPHLQP
jgi:hypothetical protein